MKDLNLTLNSRKIKTEGNLLWNYLPFRNFRSSLTIYKYENKYYSEAELDQIGIKPDNIDKDGNPTVVTLKPGLLLYLDTDKLNFSLDHPVDLLPQWSYDNSVNLVVTQDNDYPKIFNSRFSVTSKNRYLIVDRKGTNDTNIYDDDYFEEDSALYKNTREISQVEYLGTVDSGNLYVGNYHFYFRYCDDDGNQSDFFAETGVVSIFRGATPQSICSGFANLSSYKGVQLKLSNLDNGYSYIEVYYTRAAADINENSTTTAHKIDQKYSVNDSTCTLTITGYESVIDVALSDINPVYQVFEGVSTQATAQNMLFFGNVTELDIKYEKLQNLSYSIIPYYNTEQYNISDKIKTDYRKQSSAKLKETYYNSKFIHDKTGYWPGEIYRFGIVYIFKNNVLSPVFNIRGRELLHIKNKKDEDYATSKYDIYTGLADIKYNKDTYFVENRSAYENVKGVVKIPNSNNTQDIYSIVFECLESEFIKELLKDLGVIGYFFVRQKRLPTTLCQAFTIGVDNESHVPAIPTTKGFTVEGFLQKDDTTDKEYTTSFNLGVFFATGSILAGKVAGSTKLAKKLKTNISYLTHEYKQHVHYLGSSDVNVGAICPEYDVNSPQLNSLFTGAEYPIRVLGNISLSQEKWNQRSYYSQQLLLENSESDYIDTKIIGVEDNVKLVAIGDTYFSARAGEAEEAFRYEYIGWENKVSEATNLVRGSFGPYIGTDLPNSKVSKLIEIKIPKYDEDNMDEYFNIRMHDASSYYAINNRQIIDVLASENKENIFRGDCYICQFTHRVNRNFQDPTAPANDKILDVKCWKENYKVTDGVVDKTNFDKINLGDVNAVKLGQWVTFVLRSNFNLSVRSIDESYVTEKLTFGGPRAFFPYLEMLVSGSAKIPEALCINKGFQKSVSDRYNFEVADVPAFKNDFTNRISYSNIDVTDAFKNGFRTFEGSNYYDYPKTYGSITKLVEIGGNLLCVFEHGIGVIAVKERTLAASGAGGNAYVNTTTVLPENPNIISTCYGSLWKDSIIKTESGVYGVDTVAKKIWFTDGSSVTPISDQRVLLFLNRNITLSEREVSPIVGFRNVKTHYNAFKKDVMFTFYDDTETNNECVWNLCWNETAKGFTTFYSWVPSFSESIDNIYFSFDRETSKKLADWSYKYGALRDGLYLEYQYLLPTTTESRVIYISNGKEWKLNGETEPNILTSYYNNYLTFEKELDSNNNFLYWKLIYNPNFMFEKGSNEPTSLYKTFEYNNWEPLQLEVTLEDETVQTATLEFTNKTVTETTDFWKHGLAGIIDTQGTIKPTHWYGDLHPFEFEFVVNDNASYHKIFDDLQIISNNAEPESFHYEIIGDSYSFANDKENMYIRQEATKHLLQENGYDVSYDDSYLDETKMKESRRDINGLPLQKQSDAALYDKSTVMPLYYYRQDKTTAIEDYYHRKDGIKGKDFSALAGGEVVWDETLDEFRIWNHAEAINLTDPDKGRLRGNMHYKEDKWYVQINPINFVQKNEPYWENDKVPIEVLLNNTLEALLKSAKDGVIKVGESERGIVAWQNTEINNQEVKPKDKWMKVRIRYKGDKLAIIAAVITLYSITTA